MIRGYYSTGGQLGVVERTQISLEQRTARSGQWWWGKAPRPSFRFHRVYANIIFMVTVRGCSKCLGATIPSDDGNKCVICGYTDYSTAPTYKIKRTKHEGVHEHATILIRKMGQSSLYHAKTAYVMSFTNGYGNQAFRYEMNCPYDNCKQRCATKRYSHKREFKYKCKNRHIWYLIMKDDEPVYWRY